MPLDLALEGAQGRSWYTAANQQILDAAPELGVTPKTLADTLAIFSPRMSVTRSIRVSLHYIATGTVAPDVTISVRQALAHWHRTGTIRGPKTSAFSRALLGDDEAIVLDVWMARALDLDQRLFGTKWGYQVGETLVRRTASALGWSPAETQAAVWCGIVARHGRRVPELALKRELIRHKENRSARASSTAA